MNVTKNDIASGRFVVMPLEPAHASVQEFLNMVYALERKNKAHKRQPSHWATCIGADTERKVLVCCVASPYDGDGYILETDGGPAGNFLTHDVPASFRVVDVATGQEVARTA